MKRTLFFLIFALPACQFSPFPQDVFNETQSESEAIRDVGGNPSPGSREIYTNADLKNLCVDQNECGSPYAVIPKEWIHIVEGECSYDLDPNAASTFVLNRSENEINGVDLLLSKEDLFFLAWTSIRFQINPYFLLGVLLTESSGNCALVSASHAEGCFQITNHYGQSQLRASYLSRVKDWFWSDRSGEKYPDSIFVDEESYFGESPLSRQYRMTLDPGEFVINDTEISSVVNFPFGIIGAGLYFHWQEYLLLHHFEELNNKAESLFNSKEGRALFQAASYNGGAYGAARALEKEGSNFLDLVPEETRNYAPSVVDVCLAYQEGEGTFGASYSQADLEFIIDLLATTYPGDLALDWKEVKSEISQIFFEDGTELLSFVDDIKAIVYVISTFVPELAPEWPDKNSI